MNTKQVNENVSLTIMKPNDFHLFEQFIQTAYKDNQL